MNCCDYDLKLDPAAFAKAMARQARQPPHPHRPQSIETVTCATWSLKSVLQTLSDFSVVHQKQFNQNRNI